MFFEWGDIKKKNLIQKIKSNEGSRLAMVGCIGFVQEVGVFFATNAGFTLSG